MSEFTSIDWEGDEMLRNPSELDKRVDKLLADTEHVASESSVTSPSSYFSTPPSTSSTTSSQSMPVVVKSPVAKRAKLLPCSQEKPPGQSDPAWEGATIAPPTQNSLHPVVKIKWESPEEKIKKYESRQHRYYEQKMAYEDRFKKMKTMVRNIKATENQLLPPREEVVNLFEKVSSFGRICILL